MTKGRNKEDFYTRKQNIYTALEELDFHFDEADLPKFREHWEGGTHILHIAEVLKRKPVEVILLILDQHIKGKIEPREGGLFGFHPSE